MGFSGNNQLESFNSMKNLFKCFEKLRALPIHELRVDSFIANIISCFANCMVCGITQQWGMENIAGMSKKMFTGAKNKNIQTIYKICLNSFKYYTTRLAINI